MKISVEAEPIMGSRMMRAAASKNAAKIDKIDIKTRKKRASFTRITARRFSLALLRAKYKTIPAITAAKKYE